MRSLPGPFDFVFIDADKTQLPRLLRGRPAQAGVGRAHRRRQHLVERERRERRRPVTRHAGHPCLQRRRRRRRAGGVRPAHGARRCHSDPPGRRHRRRHGRVRRVRGPIRISARSCSTTTSISGRTGSATPRPPSTRWPPTASGPQARGRHRDRPDRAPLPFRAGRPPAARVLGGRAGRRPARVHGPLLGRTRPRRPRRLRRVCASGQGRRSPRRPRPRGRLLPWADGRRRHPARRLSLRRPARLGPLDRHMAIRRPGRPRLHGRVVGARRRRRVVRLRDRHRGARRLGDVRRPRPSRSGEGGRPPAGRTRGVLGPSRRGRRVVGDGGRAVVGRLAQAGGRGVSVATPAGAVRPSRGARSPPPPTPTAWPTWPTGRPTWPLSWRHWTSTPSGPFAAADRSTCPARQGCQLP